MRAAQAPGERRHAAASEAGYDGGLPKPPRRGLAPQAIRRVVLAHKKALSGCYEVLAKKDPSLQGSLAVTWTIDAGGAVTSATVTDSTIHDARVETCAVDQVRTWRFPSSDAASQVTYPFSFGVWR